MSDFRYSDNLDALDGALQYLKGKYGEEDLQLRSVLDLGCGTGRLMPRLSMLFSSVTGLEPDPERCDEAMERILDEDLENATALCMDLQEYIREFPNQTFDVVVCSHVFEHMKHETACGILEDLKQVMGPDSVCLFATTFTEGRRNVYTGEPEVCLFAQPWMERFLSSCGLKTKQFGSYPYEDAQSALYICEPVEGTLLRRSCGPETASGKVCYMHCYYLNNSAVMDTYRLRRWQEAEAEEVDEIRDAFTAAEGFLYGGELPFPALRHFRRTEVRCGKAAIADSHLIVSFYPASGIAQVSVCLSLEDAPCDSFVFLHQVRDEEEDFFTIDGKAGSIPKLCEEVLKDCGLRNFRKGAASVITELNRFGLCTDPLALTPEERLCLYGILTGDEGYLHVPQAAVDERMAWTWTDRDFARVIAYNGSFLLLNFTRSDTYADYIDYQLPYAEHYYGGLDEYFTLDAPTAGVDHGLFFSVETGLLVQTVVDRLKESSGRLFSKDSSRHKKQVRMEVMRTLNGLDRVTDPEPASLDSLVLRSLAIPRKIGRIRSTWNIQI